MADCLIQIMNPSPWHHFHDLICYGPFACLILLFLTLHKGTAILATCSLHKCTKLKFLKSLMFPFLLGCSAPRQSHNQNSHLTQAFTHTPPYQRGLPNYFTQKNNPSSSSSCYFLTLFYFLLDSYGQQTFKYSFDYPFIFDPYLLPETLFNAKSLDPRKHFLHSKYSNKHLLMKERND